MWYPKYPLLYQLLSQLIGSKSMKNGCLTKQPLKHVCLGYQLGIITILHYTSYIFELLYSANVWGLCLVLLFVDTWMWQPLIPITTSHSQSGHEKAAVVVGGRRCAGGSEHLNTPNEFCAHPTPPPPAKNQQKTLNMLRSHEDFKISDCWETAQISVGSHKSLEFEDLKNHWAQTRPVSPHHLWCSLQDATCSINGIGNGCVKAMSQTNYTHRIHGTGIFTYSWLNGKCRKICHTWIRHGVWETYHTQ